MADREIRFATLTMFRSQETQRAYNTEHKGGAQDAGEPAIGGIARSACKFCDFYAEHDEVLEAQQGFVVVTNKFPYDQWDAREVRDHRLVIPDRHVVGLKELTADEKLAWFDIVGDYEDRGYTSFTRSPENPGKSINHLHTHLIRVDMGSRAVRYLHYDGAQGVSEFRFEDDSLGETAVS